MLDRRLLAPHALAAWARRSPDAPALVQVDGPRLTYAELLAESYRWATCLRELGVGVGTHVATLLTDGFDPHRAMLGLAWLRAVEVPLNTAYVGEMLRHTLAVSEATTLVTTSALLTRVAEVAGSLPALTRVLLVDEPAGAPGVTGPGGEASSGGQAGGGEDAGGRGNGGSRGETGVGAEPGAAWPAGVTIVSLGPALAATEPATDFAGPDVSDVNCLLFTSGTTGPSKAVITPWGLTYQMWSWVPEDTLAPGEALYSAMALFHNSGRSGFNYVLGRGGCLVTRPKFSATHVWADVRRYDCVALALVGPLTALLFAAPPRPDDADNPVRGVILGPMIGRMAEFERRFGVRVATCYGQTEVGAPLATGWDHGPWENTGLPRASWPGFETRIVDDSDEPVPAGQVGELVVRAREPWSMSLGYHGMAEASAAAWRNGWFHTGDAFRADADGRHYFVDRLRDTIRRRGENISSFEVEAAVAAHPGIRECAAVGVRTELGDDEVLVAVIAADPSFDPADLVAFLDGRLPAFMVPRYVEVVDDLPRTSTTGRVRKNELRARGLPPTAWDRLAAPATAAGRRSSSG
ncbi:AMP-binding protein [Frankia sp. CNm7]|uniref:AMP-binding protein n=1 Tax=Frankia nepalensis TaxID=1836974 RepID=A0A937URK8_9ACTN|nr:AMP-binding protein [Frankia nepalensis]MBL7500503.1 AMP-binding protein [Frankia nepalensis]MBL7511218.1 AMP-binding protein [Frankia nepalensis]MBL7518942.1 AMP-binding protein [Frankia nepalensis]MBL7631472.1 AMP-binding protein [Frankia nepalensis]